MIGYGIAAPAFSALTQTRYPLGQVLSLLVGASVISGAAFAQETAPINAERPGFSSSPLALAPGIWQLEMGYQYARDRGSQDLDSQTAPLLLVRRGLIEDLEVQLSWPGVSREETVGRDTQGANDAAVGIKWQAMNGSRAAIGLFAGLSVPVGADEFSSDEADPSLGLFWSYSGVGDLFGTILLAESKEDSAVSNAVGWTFPLRGNRSAFVEYFGTYGSRGGPEHNMDGGISFLLRNNVQFDVNGGFGLSGNATDFFMGFGLAYRFD